MLTLLFGTLQHVLTLWWGDHFQLNCIVDASWAVSNYLPSSRPPKSVAYAVLPVLTKKAVCYRVCLGAKLPSFHGKLFGGTLH